MILQQDQEIHLSVCVPFITGKHKTDYVGKPQKIFYFNSNLLSELVFLLLTLSIGLFSSGVGIAWGQEVVQSPPTEVPEGYDKVALPNPPGPPDAFNIQPQDPSKPYYVEQWRKNADGTYSKYHMDYNAQGLMIGGITLSEKDGAFAGSYEIRTHHTFTGEVKIETNTAADKSYQKIITDSGSGKVTTENYNKDKIIENSTVKEKDGSYVQTGYNGGKIESQQFVNAKGQKIKEIRVDLSSNKETTSNYTYDANNNVISSTSKTVWTDPNDPKKQIVTNDQKWENGILVKETQVDPQSNAKTEMTYDPVTKVRETVATDGSGKVTYKETVKDGKQVYLLTYDETTKATTIRKTDDTGTHQTTTRLDKDGKEVVIGFRNWDKDGKFVNSMEKLDDGSVVLAEARKSEDGKDQILSVKKDAQNNVISKSLSDDLGILFSWSKDRDGNTQTTRRGVDDRKNNITIVKSELVNGEKTTTLVNASGKTMHTEITSTHSGHTTTNVFNANGQAIGQKVKNYTAFYDTRGYVVGRLTRSENADGSMTQVMDRPGGSPTVVVVPPDPKDMETTVKTDQSTKGDTTASGGQVAPTQSGDTANNKSLAGSSNSFKNKNDSKVFNLTDTNIATRAKKESSKPGSEVSGQTSTPTTLKGKENRGIVKTETKDAAGNLVETVKDKDGKIVSSTKRDKDGKTIITVTTGKDGKTLTETLTKAIPGKPGADASTKITTVKSKDGKIESVVVKKNDKKGLPLHSTTISPVTSKGKSIGGLGKYKASGEGVATKGNPEKLTTGIQAPSVIESRATGNSRMSGEAGHRKYLRSGGTGDTGPDNKATAKYGLIGVTEGKNIKGTLGRTESREPPVKSAFSPKPMGTRPGVNKITSKTDKMGPMMIKENASVMLPSTVRQTSSVRKYDIGSSTRGRDKINLGLSMKKGSGAIPVAPSHLPRVTGSKPLGVDRSATMTANPLKAPSVPRGGARDLGSGSVRLPERVRPADGVNFRGSNMPSGSRWTNRDITSTKSSVTEKKKKRNYDDAGESAPRSNTSFSPQGGGRSVSQTLAPSSMRNSNAAPPPRR